MSQFLMHLDIYQDVPYIYCPPEVRQIIVNSVCLKASQISMDSLSVFKPSHSTLFQKPKSRPFLGQPTMSTCNMTKCLYRVFLEEKSMITIIHFVISLCPEVSLSQQLCKFCLPNESKKHQLPAKLIQSIIKINLACPLFHTLMVHWRLLCGK